ncbi:MAG TPA: Mut7-C RNAse domain-containing protein [Pyrinomonadaceae bacterium]|nr:Mut7-C RNAse domain-containing protein [Pyrinomonadaceae bacterium]
MAVSCAECGRQYDVTLFQFGRTINCACGKRVGLEHRINLPARGSGRRGERDEIRFFADVMVARLVRWLRAIGIDTIWEDAVSDRDLVKKAVEEKRFILTLDKPLLEEWRVDNVLLLQSENPPEQFREVVSRFGIEKPKEFFTRCLVCNTPFRSASDEEIAAGAPLDVRQNQETFDYCPNCEKLYWQGSHTKRMRRAIEEIFSAEY